MFKKNIFMLTVIFLILSALISFNLLAEELEKSAEIREIEVILNNFDFVPDQITVKPGEKVKFKLINPSSAYHTFTIYNSKTDREEAVLDIALSAGEEKEVVVQMPAKATELYLVCLPHEGIEMTGKVIVEENNMNHQ